MSVRGDLRSTGRILAAAFAGAAAMALLRYKRGVMEVIAACAVSGLLLQALL